MPGCDAGKMGFAVGMLLGVAATNVDDGSVLTAVWQIELAESIAAIRLAIWCVVVMLIMTVFRRIYAFRGWRQNTSARDLGWWKCVKQRLQSRFPLWMPVRRVVVNLYLLGSAVVVVYSSGAEKWLQSVYDRGDVTNNVSRIERPICIPARCVVVMLAIVEILSPVQRAKMVINIGQTSRSSEMGILMPLFQCVTLHIWSNTEGSLQLFPRCILSTQSHALGTTSYGYDLHMEYTGKHTLYTVQPFDQVSNLSNQSWSPLRPGQPSSIHPSLARNPRTEIWHVPTFLRAGIDRIAWIQRRITVETRF